MRKATIAFAVVIITSILFCQCNPVLVPLKGKYSDSVLEIKTTQSTDTVWFKLNNIFTTNGLDIKKMDKQNGTIRTVKAPINSLYTFENEDGKLEQPQAWVVLNRVFNKKKEWKPKDIYGEWRIQVSGAENGMTSIKIDPIVICTSFPNTFTSLEHRQQSTGKLEELLAHSLKNN